MADLMIESGSVTLLRLFDIAYSIDLRMAESRCACRGTGSPTRSRLASAPVKALAFDVPPLLLTLETLVLKDHGRDLHAHVSARLYDFGVIGLSLRFPVEEMTWESYTSFANRIDRIIGPNVDGGPWHASLKHITDLVGDSLTRPFPTPLSEDHLVASVHRWNQPVDTSQLLERIDLVPLLSGEDRPLSEKSRDDLLKHRFSYYGDDLAVVTWDRAFLVEPRGDTDVADVLEVANAQLLEFRYYDELLDDELPLMYELVKSARRRFPPAGSRRFADLARSLHTLVAEVTELTERADNVLQVTEDVYLARVYRAALDIFGVPTVAAAVDRKLGIIRDTYTALHEEASGARGELLELAVILLILIEIVIALIRHVG